MLDLLLKNCSVVTESDKYRADIEVKGDTIVGLVKLGDGEKSKKVIDCSDKTVIPGCIDTHVHFNEPGYTHREEFKTGTKAAARGGITTVVDMPIANKPNVTDSKSLNKKVKKVKDRAFVDYSFWGGIVDNNFEQLKGQKENGVVGVKGFTIDQLSEFKWLNNGALYDGLKKCSEIDLLVSLHCENNSLVSYRKEKYKDSSKDKKQQIIEDFLRIYSKETELTAVNNALEFAKDTDARLHILHASLPETIDMVEEAKNEGVNVTVETCPHYLLFERSDLLSHGVYAKCTPPIRDKSSVEGLWNRLLEGKIDTISSDHSPSTIEEKEAGDNFWKAWGGIQGVQFTVQLLLDEGVHKRGMSLKNFVSLLSSNPARLINMYPVRGTIRVGSEATFTILDLDKKWTINKDDIESKNKHSPYIGRNGKGVADKIILRGEEILLDGKPLKGKRLVV